MTVQESDLDVMMSAARVIGQRLSELKGQREQLEQERIRNRAVVGTAKWRVEQKATVEKVFEAAQARLHAKAVGSYEQLLTMIANDVLPSKIRIRLDLGTNRRNGKPSLDIVAERDGGSVDVSRASGGSLMNVLATGLRVSALSKSGARQFVAFDESECWISPDNVPAYGNVLVRLSTDLGFQCLLISHHDPRMFHGAFIVRLDGTPETGLVAIPEGTADEGTEASTNLFRSIRLVNFRSHSDTVVPLSPGMTCLVGGNDIGKSAVVSALGVLVDGDLKDSDIRHGTKEAAVELTLADGRVASVRKSAKRKMRWELRLPSGERQQSEGSDVPGFIADALGMHLSEDMNLHIARQTKPNFLLDDDSGMGTKRAEVLSVGREAVHLDRLMDAWQRNVRDDGGTIRKGEIEDARIEHRLNSLSAVPGLMVDAEHLSAGIGKVRTARADALELFQTTDQVEAAITRCTELEEVAGRLTPLSEPPILEETEALSSLLGEIERSKAEIASALDRQRVLAALWSPPDLEPTDQLGDMVRRLEDASSRATVLYAVSRALADIPALAALEDTAGLLEAARDLANTSATVAELEAVSAVLEAVPELPTLEEDDGLEAASLRLDEAVARCAWLERELAALASVVPPPTLHPVDGLMEAADSVEEASSEVWRLEGASSAMVDLPPPPELQDGSGLIPMADRLEAAHNEMASLLAEAYVLDRLASPPELVDAMDLEEAATGIEAAAEATTVIEARFAALEALPDPPAVLQTDGYLEIVARLEESAQATEAHRQEASRLDAELADVEERLRAWRDENKGICPTCGRDGYDPLAPGAFHAHH
ncbi:AAA family ATPase [Microvirga splendida]|uniref:AAA family ATPase n=1 Tax=Microvirga splendida TaxID=2795727 RepID=A0ABS0XXM6_9HYPH|nr:AAA family ATPase [Microvirga splendida]MBJ6124812.1 AAA family ATPase [Microvirga splendida]